MNKALIIIKSPGIGDLQILLSNIHQISKKIGKPVTVLAQKIRELNPFLSMIHMLTKY